VTPRSGTPYSLVSGASHAEVTGTGAALRGLSLDGIAVLDGFGIDELAPGGAGQVLAPWPNRLEDGKYTFDGTAASVPINEVERMNAIHGLVRWTEWTPVRITDSSTTLSTTLAPQSAYPWRLRLELTYALMPASFDVGFVAYNDDDRPAPFGIGFHPYFLAEGGDVDAASISMHAATHLRLDDRALPVGGEPVAGGRFAAMASIEGLAARGAVLDDCFTDLVRGGEFANLTYHPGPASRPVELTLTGAFTHVMCFTGDTLAPPRRRRAMAIEPMTCAPNALRSGAGIATILPGESFSGSYIVSLG
jgi:aldose 1-epimerase